MAKLNIEINKATGTLALMGIILMVFSVLMTWLDVNTNPDISATGIDLFSNDDLDDWQFNIPMIVTILGVIMLILEFVSILVPNMSKKIEASMPLIVFVFSLISIILFVLFATWDEIDDPVQVGGGAYAVLLGAIICLCATAGQAFAILKQKTQ